MGVEKPDSGTEPVQVKVDPDRPQTLQHFDFVDSDEECAGMRKIRNRSIGQSSTRHCSAASTTHITVASSVTSATITSSSSTNYSSSQPKKMKCKHSIAKTGQSSAADKRSMYDLPSIRKLTSKGHSNNKTETLKDVCSEDGRIPTPQLDTAATPSPLKEPHVSCGLGSGDGSESSLRSSLLDEVLSEKKLLLMRSPSVIKFFKGHQSLLTKRSSNILQLGTHNLMDKPLGKS